MASPRIISIRLTDQAGGTGVDIELGNSKLEKQIPTGFGLSRLSLIINDKGELFDAELVTEKI